MCFGAACLTSLFFLWVGICKPNFFWRSSQAINVRRRLGDRQARMLYIAIGAALMAILMATYGGTFMGGQLLYAVVFGLAVFIGFKTFAWFRRPKPSAKEAELQRQRRRLAHLMRH